MDNITVMFSSSVRVVLSPGDGITAAKVESSYNCKACSEHAIGYADDSTLVAVVRRKAPRCPGGTTEDPKHFREALHSEKNMVLQFFK